MSSSERREPAPPRAARKAAGPSEASLERAAVHYLRRFSSSSENLRRVLRRKALRRAREAAGQGASADEAALGPLVDAVVAKAVRSGLLDDRAYAEGKTASLLRRGTSTRAAAAKLAAKGVPSEAAAAALARAEPDELALARRYAERRRLGPWRTRPDPDKRERDLAALVRAGFPYAIAKAALDEPEER